MRTFPGFPFFFLAFFFRPDPSLIMAANVVEFMRWVTLTFKLLSPAGNKKERGKSKNKQQTLGHVVQKRYAGEQQKQWGKKNSLCTSFKIVLSLGLSRCTALLNLLNRIAWVSGLPERLGKMREGPELVTLNSLQRCEWMVFATFSKG